MNGKACGLLFCLPGLLLFIGRGKGQDGGNTTTAVRRETLGSGKSVRANKKWEQKQCVC